MLSHPPPTPHISMPVASRGRGVKRAATGVPDADSSSDDCSCVYHDGADGLRDVVTACLKSMKVSPPPLPQKPPPVHHASPVGKRSWTPTLGCGSPFLHPFTSACAPLTSLCPCRCWAAALPVALSVNRRAYLPPPVIPSGVRRVSV